MDSWMSRRNFDHHQTRQAERELVVNQTDIRGQIPRGLQSWWWQMEIRDNFHHFLPILSGCVFRTFSRLAHFSTSECANVLLRKIESKVLLPRFALIQSTNWHFTRSCSDNCKCVNTHRSKMQASIATCLTLETQKVGKYFSPTRELAFSLQYFVLGKEAWPRFSTAITAIENFKLSTARSRRKRISPRPSFLNFAHLISPDKLRKLITRERRKEMLQLRRNEIDKATYTHLVE